MSGCPCGSGSELSGCCGPLLAGEKRAATAEQLMRSRFTAYAVGDVDYVRQTWHPQTCPKHLTLDDSIRWTRLDVVATDRGSLFDTTGTVEFRAFFRQDGQRDVMHEVSEFVRLDRSWVYLSGRHT
ncbi:YchJ family protein [Smaragdicoccus niigatensis]|uniref:YchJ family protein n=1 Tax=Smaragdicoccus niigatensis TaxID=359359 RepID=UPI0003A30039|nr:YchJ family protein [Smaragdicoccus niigatensis]